MPAIESDRAKLEAAGIARSDALPPFGVNELRLGPWEWLITWAIVLALAIVAPRVWAGREHLPAGADYRIPYSLSKDYWLWQRRVDSLDGHQIPILGDSVVWGEYVLPDGTLSHCLNSQAGQSGRFVNCGLNGLFPLAMEGLVENYGAQLRGRTLLLHCNLLWMTSPQADLSATREQSFNHSRLVPQFSPRIPCYRADTTERLSAAIENHVPYFAWINHLECAYFDGQSVPQWTLTEDDGNSPRLINAWRSPLEPIARGLPGEPAHDPQRGPTSKRHKAWTADGAQPQSFDWVKPEDSLQWQAIQRIVGKLRDRGNNVLVILGPFNEHMIAADERPTFYHWRDTVAGWLREQNIPFVVPETLPSNLYADASHPLTDGYRLLAERLLAIADFRVWLQHGSSLPPVP